MGKKIQSAGETKTVISYERVVVFAMKRANDDQSPMSIWRDGDLYVVRDDRMAAPFGGFRFVELIKPNRPC